MILIWDNGGEYSDHTIYFIDTLDLNIDDCLKLLKARQPEGKLLAEVYKVTWFEGGCISISDFVSYWNLEDFSVIYDIDPMSLKKLFKVWEEKENELLRKAASAQSDFPGWYKRVKKRYEKEFLPLKEYCDKL